jgi:hypothetical protein
LSVGIPENFLFSLLPAARGMVPGCAALVSRQKFSRLLLKGVRIIAPDVQIARQSFRAPRAAGNASVFAPFALMKNSHRARARQ